MIMNMLYMDPTGMNKKLVVHLLDSYILERNPSFYNYIRRIHVKLRFLELPVSNIPKSKYYPHNKTYLSIYFISTTEM